MFTAVFFFLLFNRHMTSGHTSTALQLNKLFKCSTPVACAPEPAILTPCNTVHLHIRLPGLPLSTSRFCSLTVQQQFFCPSITRVNHPHSIKRGIKPFVVSAMLAFQYLTCSPQAASNVTAPPIDYFVARRCTGETLLASPVHNAVLKCDAPQARRCRQPKRLFYEHE